MDIFTLYLYVALFDGSKVVGIGLAVGKEQVYGVLFMQCVLDRRLRRHPRSTCPFCVRGCFL